MSKRDELLAALHVIVQGYLRGNVEAADCAKSYATAKKLFKSVKPKGPQDQPIAGASDGMHMWAAICAAKAKDCKTAYRLFKDGFKPTPAYSSLKSDKAREGYIRTGFKNSVGTVAGQCQD
jgi:hypothetical protein